MKTTPDMFRLLSSAVRMDSCFATFLAGMGKRLQPKDEHFMSSYFKFNELHQLSGGERLEWESFGK